MFGDGSDQGRLLAAVLQGSADAILLADFASGTMVDANPAAERLLRRRREDIVDQSGADIGLLATMADRDAMVATLERQGTFGPVEADIRVPPDERRRIQFTAQRLNVRGRDCILAIVRDITDLHRTQADLMRSLERLRANYDSLPLPAATWERVGGHLVLVDANEATLEATGGQVTRIYGRSVEQLYGEEPGLLPLLERAEREGRAVTDEVRYHLRSTGEHRDLIVTCVPFEDGTVTMYLHDVTPLRALAENARRDQQMLRAMLDTANDAIISIDTSGTVTDWNRRAEEMFGCSRDEALGADVAELVVPPEMRDAHRHGLLRAVTSTQAGVLRHVRVALEAQRTDGARFPAEVRVWSSGEGEMRRFHAVVTDITDRRRADEEAARSARTLALFAENAVDFIYRIRVKPSMALEYASPGIHAITGYTAEDLAADPSRMVSVYVGDGDPIDWTALRPGEMATQERQITHRDGHAVWVSFSVVAVGDEVGDIAAFEGIASDITARRRLEEQLRHQAFHDSLTGLPNRALLLDRLDHALRRRGGACRRVAVLFIDLDRFKIVNDLRGHAIGDRLLRAAAERLTGVLRTGDTLARLGGDEFAVVIEDATSPEVAQALGERIVSAFETPFVIEGADVFVSASIGIASGSRDVTAEQLLGDADAAMYEAKQRGRARVVVFEKDLRRQMERRAQVESRLRRAVMEGTLTVAYQPVVMLPSGTPVGAEALLRWTDEQLGAVSPAEFIPVAEETGLIVPIGRRVLDIACAEAARWQERFPGMRLSVNLSPRQLFSRELVDVVRRTLESTGLDPELLAFEITESAVIRDADQVVTILHELRGLGVRVVVDDFGTGYSSLSYLNRFPVDALKIDRSFVSRMPADGNASAIVAAVMAVAQAMGLRVVAEGVETVEQRDALAEMRCDMAQGYLFARPVPQAELLDVVTRLRAGASG